jgi:dTDP-4-dehydrorhamnose 3,5-epimerase
MKFIETDLQGLLIVEPDVFKDQRGYFFESFSDKRYKEAGINHEFVQDNISKSVKNTIRGLHYQVGEFAQGKLCQAIVGEVLDVAVDVRFGSPTFGKHVSVILSEENRRQLWMPPGFAHGFAVLSEIAIFHYKCTSYYSKKDERGILYNDSELKINWGISDPVVSEKDLSNVEFKKIGKDYIYKK